MKKFFYKVKKNNNEYKEGYINGIDLSDAAKKLEKQGYIILELNEEIQSASFIPANLKHITQDTVFTISEKKEFFNALYHQYKSGLPILEIFKSIMKSSNNPNIRGLCYQVIIKVEKGHSLNDAFKKFENALGSAYTKLICAGEETGKLEEILLSIIKNITREDEVKQNLISSLTYPAILVCMSICVAILFKSFVFKIFDSMDDGISQEIIIKLAINTCIQILTVLTVIIGFGIFLTTNEKAKKQTIEFFSKFIFISSLMKYYYFQSFFTIMALAYSAGVPASESVILANSVIKIKSIQQEINKAIKMIINGCKITTALGITGVFSNYAMSQISTGEQSGELDKMYKIIANDYEKKLETRIKVFIKLLEPILFVLIGILVLYIAYNAYNKYYSSLFSMI